MKYRGKKQLVRAFLGALVWGAFLVAGPEAVVAEEVTKNYVPSSLVTIQGKSRDAVLISEGRFLVTARTKIFDPQGGKMSIRNLPVPCEAKIQYQLSPYLDPGALRIIVTRVLPGATRKWTVPVPE